MIFLHRVIVLNSLADIDDDVWRRVISPELDDVLAEKLASRKASPFLKGGSRGISPNGQTSGMDKKSV